MAKRKPKNKNNKASGSFSVWKAVKILLLLGVGYAAGWNFGYVSGRDDGISAARNSSGTQNSSDTDISNTDNYGRSPGHPHYGHAHP